MKNGIINFSLAVYLAIFPAIAGALTVDEFEGTQEAVQPGNAFSSITQSGAIGFARKMAVSKDNAAPGFMRASVISGSYLHSQDAQVFGKSFVYWDGGTSNGINFSGLGGINLLQDGGTGIVMDVSFLDLPVMLTVTLYDASDSTGAKASVVTLPLNNSNAGQSLFVPFSSFTASGPGGPASLSRIGAISLLIDGGQTAAVDFVISWIGTNGICRLVPNASGRVIDDCGVCGGDNSSCTDCSGMLFGSAKLDRCGVCNGDGNTCLGCTISDLSPLLGELDGGAKKQENLVRRIYKEIDHNTSDPKIKAKTQQLRKRARSLQIRNWVLSWVVPRYFQQCTNQTFCGSVSTRPTMSEYRKNSNTLRQMAIDAVKLLQKVANKGPNYWKTYINTGNALHSNNMKLADEVPVAHQNCS